MTSIYIGALSGTSLDSIDIGFFSFPDFQVHYYAEYPLPRDVVTRFLTAQRRQQIGFTELADLDSEIGTLFAQAIQQALKVSGYPQSAISAIGSHGITLYHRPGQTHRGYSWQIGNPNIIAHDTGIPTVSDLRGMDIASGGQGAPLAPAFHAAIFRHATQRRAIVNIGGISNITILPAVGQSEAITGCDLGPGNCLLDEVTFAAYQQTYDKDGYFAKQGEVDEQALHCLLSDPYFTQPGPKSTGREYFHATWLQQKLAGHALLKRPVDVLATLVALTCTLIQRAIAAAEVEGVFICGGGACNPYLMARLNQYCAVPVTSTASLGLPPEQVEAGLFAWLAYRKLTQRSGNLPEVTGALHTACLGALY